MCPSTEDNLGRRRFLLHRDKAVEHALERIRHGKAAEWATLQPEERAGLKSALTEMWENIDRERWHQYSFSLVTRPDILKLVILGNDIRTRHHMTDETRAAVERILFSSSQDNPPQ